LSLIQQRLMRSSFKERVEAWTVGTKGGLFTFDEARADFSLSKVPFGDQPRVQQQDVPLSYGHDLKPPVPKPPAPPARTVPPPPSDNTNRNTEADIVRSLFVSADEYERSGFKESDHPRDPEGKFAESG
jgi:hypothetical protein